MREMDPPEDQFAVKISRVRAGNDLPLPSYQSSGSAGMDVMACLEEPVEIGPGETTLIPTGFAIAVPEGFEAQIRPRSGLAVKHGIGLINSPGTIDADYRGEVKIAVINLGKNEYAFQRGDRVAQMVINRVYRARPQQVTSLDETDRNDGGFGHTGK